MMGGSGYGSVPLTNGFGYERKAQKLTDPKDPEHWVEHLHTYTYS
jgi:hypothetical protein